MTHTKTLAPLAVGKDEGEAIWWFGGLAVIKATGADTAGATSVIEITEPPNLEGPLHVHHREEEGFYILEGSATFQIGDQTVEAKPGDYLLGPRDVPHKFDTGPEGCRMLFIMTPAGFEDLVREMGEPAGSWTLPPMSDEEPDLERVAQIAEKYGCELVGE
jgi:mannose-6-phosphate isomerase-like protein (cupin superfamily)